MEKRDLHQKLVACFVFLDNGYITKYVSTGYLFPICTEGSDMWSQQIIYRFLRIYAP